MKKSKIGIVFALLYLIATLIIWIIAHTCGDMYCGMIIVLPVMPWAFLLQGTITGTFFDFFILVALNSILIYSVGWLISLLFKKLK